MTDPAVEVTDLHHAYGERAALAGVSLQVSRGEIFGLLGPNGSGKTTLFRLISTLIPAPPGAIRVFGHDVAADAMTIRGLLGVVFQSPSVDKHLTARENLIHQGHLYGLKGAALAQRAEAALKAVGLFDRAGERIERFSGGMRRRVEVAKALLHQPRLLLMDEPSTGLDPGARIEMWTHLRELAASGVTILLTTHLMEEAEHCSRLAILQNGKVLACDTPAALRADIGGDVITLTSGDPLALQRAIKKHLEIDSEILGAHVRLQRTAGHTLLPALFENAGGLIDAVSVAKPTLEDVFIRLTGLKFDHLQAAHDAADVKAV